MDPIKIVEQWAKKHSEVIAVVLGGSRAKGTHLPHSDYDFSVNLTVDPSPALVERLCLDLPIENGSSAFILPLIDKHFLVVGKTYRPAKSPEITVGFVNLLAFKESLENEVNHPLVDEMFEFYKYSKIIYDPSNLIKDIQTKANIGWVHKRVLSDSLKLAVWNIDKYTKALSQNEFVTAQFVKADALWYITKVVATINNISIGSKYDYINFKGNAGRLGKKFIAPKQFFAIMESLAQNNNADELRVFMEQIKNMAEEFLR